MVEEQCSVGKAGKSVIKGKMLELFFCTFTHFDFMDEGFVYFGQFRSSCIYQLFQVFSVSIELLPVLSLIESFSDCLVQNIQIVALKIFRKIVGRSLF